MVTAMLRASMEGVTAGEFLTYDYCQGVESLYASMMCTIILTNICEQTLTRNLNLQPHPQPHPQP